MMRPPSSIVGTTPFGFMSRYHFWSLPPYCSPTFSRSYLSPHSSAHHSTFMTLIEFARPQIFISFPFSHSPHPEERAQRASRRVGTSTLPVSHPSRRPLRGLLRMRTLCDQPSVRRRPVGTD